MTTMTSLSGLKKLNMETRGVHAAVLWEPEQGIVAVREDVRRYTALDKPVGTSAHATLPASDRAILPTSRVSVAETSRDG